MEQNEQTRRDTRKYREKERTTPSAETAATPPFPSRELWNRAPGKDIHPNGCLFPAKMVS